MSEIVYTKCDGISCKSMVLAYPGAGTPEEVEKAKWTIDDLEADICPICQKTAEDLQANTATSKDLETFGAIVGAEADKAVEEAERLGLEKKVEPEPLKVSRAVFDKTLEDVVKQLRKDLKKRKIRKDFIENAVLRCRQQAERLRPQE